MTKQQKEIILELCNCNMRITAVARKMNYHKNTIVYHLEKINEETGLNPRVFDDLVKLRNEIESERSEDE